MMLTRILFVSIAFLVPACAAAQQDTGPAADVEAIHRLIGQYTKAVDTVDLSLLSQIWSHSPEVSFIYPLGEEHGLDAIEHHVFENVMGGMFSARPSGAGRGDSCGWRCGVAGVPLGISRDDAQGWIGGDHPRRRNSDLPETIRNVASGSRPLL
jgi:hypothetical protein